ncbi:MAG: GerMN domain-containing protein [Acidaminococcaceae bacterium]|nr:GerMN domain-containing protein [Acidaminococcaceae bacterium]
MRKNKVISLLLVLFVVCAMSVSGCDNKPSAQTTPGQTTTDGQKSSVAQIKEKHILYRMPQNGTQYLLAEKVDVTTSAGKQALDTAKALVETQPAKAVKATSAFPAGTKVLKLTVQGSLATVDLSKEFLTKGLGDYQQAMMVYALVNTLTEFKDIKQVQIMVEGKKVEILGQLDLSEPLTRNKTYLK